MKKIIKPSSSTTYCIKQSFLIKKTCNLALKKIISLSQNTSATPTNN